jgi:hypothetical protein
MIENTSLKRENKNILTAMFKKEEYSKRKIEIYLKNQGTIDMLIQLQNSYKFKVIKYFKGPLAYLIQQELSHDQIINNIENINKLMYEISNSITYDFDNEVRDMICVSEVLDAGDEYYFPDYNTTGMKKRYDLWQKYEKIFNGLNEVVISN